MDPRGAPSVGCKTQCQTPVNSGMDNGEEQVTITATPTASITTTVVRIIADVSVPTIAVTIIVVIAADATVDTDTAAAAAATAVCCKGASVPSGRNMMDMFRQQSETKARRSLTLFGPTLQIS